MSINELPVLKRSNPFTIKVVHTLKITQDTPFKCVTRIKICLLVFFASTVIILIKHNVQYAITFNALGLVPTFDKSYSDSAKVKVWIYG